jgi:hypothetical protein
MNRRAFMQSTALLALPSIAFASPSTNNDTLLIETSTGNHLVNKDDVWKMSSYYSKGHGRTLVRLHKHLDTYVNIGVLYWASDSLDEMIYRMQRPYRVTEPGKIEFTADPLVDVEGDLLPASSFKGFI